MIIKEYDQQSKFHDLSSIILLIRRLYGWGPRIGVFDKENFHCANNIVVPIPVYTLSILFEDVVMKIS